MRAGLLLALVTLVLPNIAQAFVSDDLALVSTDGKPDAQASYAAPFDPLEGDGVGGVTLVRESLTGDQRLRAESCADLMDVYYDGAWEVETQDTAHHTVWLIARCIALDHLVKAKADLTDSAPLLDLSLDNLPAHLAPYNDCQDRVAHIKAALAGGDLAGQMGDGWQRTDDGSNAALRVYQTASGQTVTLEVLASYQAVQPVWLVLVSNSEPIANSTFMDVWPLKLNKDGQVRFVNDLDLVQAAITACPSFLPLLLQTDCP